MQNSDFWSRITSLYVSLTSPVVLCMRNSVISIGITLLYGSQSSSVVFGCKTTSLWVPALTCGFVHLKQRLLDGNNKSLWVPVITCRFVYAKQRELHQNDKSVWVPALICVFLSIQNSDFRTRLTSLYLSQPSSVVFASKTATFGPASKSLSVPNLTCQFVRTKQRDQNQNY